MKERNIITLFAVALLFVSTALGFLIAANAKVNKVECNDEIILHDTVYIERVDTIYTNSTDLCNYPGGEQ